MRGARAGSGFAAVLISLLALGACDDRQEQRSADPSVLPVVERPQTPGSAPSADGSAPTAPADTTATITVTPSATPTATPTPTPGDTPTSEPSSTTDEPEPPPPSEPADPPEEPTSERARLEAAAVELTNAERADAGCPAVHVDERLVEAARAHSEDMVERDFFDHTNPDGEGVGDRAHAAGYQWRAISENIAWGYPTAEAVVAGWMDSDGHRRNILDCDMVDVGVGVVESSRGLTWTQVFGRR